MLNFQVDGMSCDHCRRAVTAAFDRWRPKPGSRSIWIPAGDSGGYRRREALRRPSAAPAMKQIALHADAGLTLTGMPSGLPGRRSVVRR